MGKVNVWLKRSYIVVISLIAIISFLLLGFALFSHGYLHREDQTQEMLATLHVLYGIAIIILLLTITGAFGACKHKKWALIVFVVGMILSSLFMLASEIQGYASRPQLAKEVKKQYLDLLPLANASETFIDGLNYFQREWECCGLDQGYVEWNYDIPESCLCTEESTNLCVAAPRHSSLFKDRVGDEPIMIYGKPCLPSVIANDMILVDTLLGTMLGVTLLWVLSVVLAVVVLCQLNQKQETPAVVYSSEAKAGNYTTLTEAPEDT
ncbi:tetraspanin-8-like [Embiotoca jacksoni]|uniref:tetraspanin-8-like n=1 Tax=Embiotoca jacksoni TaxID=100190 RepID=UPI0037038243